MSKSVGAGRPWLKSIGMTHQLRSPDSSSRRNTDAFTKIRKAQYCAENLAVERHADVGVCGVTDTKYTAYVQDLDRIARL